MSAKNKLSIEAMQAFCSITRKRTEARCVIVIIVDKRGVMSATTASGQEFGPSEVVNLLERSATILRGELPSMPSDETSP